MSSVRWLALELSGFGVYDSARIELPQTLGVMVAPNESGKSTLVAGLTGVVFGLPTNSDTTGWGTARYRSYTSNNRFSGRVELLARDGNRYEIRRDFESHEVSVYCLEPGASGAVFSGRHNPGARKGTGKYEELLDRLVGLDSAELFRQTFSIEQPLHTSRGLSNDVAGLLAGSGGGSHAGALAYLEGELDRRTRFTGDLGLPGRNKNKDRQLEELDSRIQELEVAIASGRDAADGLQKKQLELADASAELERLKSERTGLAARKRSASEWLAAQEAYARTQRQLSELNGRFERAVAESSKLEELRQRPAEDGGRVARDWSFVEGGAAPYLKSRREDAREALEQYRLFDEALAAAEGAASDLGAYESLLRAPDEVLGEIRSHREIESRLEEAVEVARRHLQEIERYALANDPSRGFEDVADLDGEERGRLQREARGSPAHTLIGTLVGGSAGFAGALLLQPALWLMLLLILAGAGFGLALSSVAARGSRRAREARERLARFERWRQRASADEPTDLTPYRERLEQAEEDLASFRDRLRPYLSEYDDLSGAYRQFEELRRYQEEQKSAASRYARDHWGTMVADVGGTDPHGAGGCWQRAAEFLASLGRQSETVALAVANLRALESEWSELEADAAEWDALTRARAEREQALERSEAVLQGLLGADGVDSLEGFRTKVTAKQTDALAERNAFKEVCEQNPELPRFDEPDESRREVVELHDRYTSELDRLDLKIGEVEGRVQGLLRERAELQGEKPANVAALEIELESLRKQRQELSFEVDAYALAYNTLVEASRDFQDEYLDRLSEVSSEYFRKFTGRERRVSFEVDFGVRVVEEGGEALDPLRLSQGAQDQLALAVRLAIADTISGDVHLPLVFDDPFLNCDASRLERIEESLRKIAEERQILLLSHEARFGTWGAPVKVHHTDKPELQASLSLSGSDD